jgi:BlaI family transcriptional regulator, penicillinase repressor
MPPNLQISESEAKVMQVLWDESPLAAEQICEALAVSQSWHASTIKTLLGRLVKKEAIAAKVEGRRFLYQPLISREDYVSSESRSLLDRLFEGKITPLVSHFVERKKMTKRDIAELRRLLDELDHE